MRDVAGFVLLVLAALAGFYLAAEVVLPFVVNYLLGVTLFFTAAAVLVGRFRVHPLHLESLLRPGVAPALALLSVGIPMAHASIAYVLSAIERVFLVFALNAVAPVVWTVHLLLAHRRQKARYRAEGHDIEDLLEAAKARGAALEVREDCLETLSMERPAPEPWEMALGTGDAPAEPPESTLADTRARISALRESYGKLARELLAALTEVRGGVRRPPHPDAESAPGTLARLDGEYALLAESSELLLAEGASPGAPRWDEG